MTDASRSIVPRAPALKSPEFGLALGLVVGRFALDMHDLHYGYWTPDLALTAANLPVAQARYTDKLMADIPEGVKTILDVGCGAGNTAKKLLDRGYEVVCLSPNEWLNAEAQKAVGNRAVVHLSRF
jgi:MPBQ/MSBQ methyltransferase